MADTPKFEPKMLMLPIMMLASRQLKFSTPNPDYICEPGADGKEVCPEGMPKELPNQEMIEYAQMGLIGVAVLLMTVYYYIYGRIEANAKKDDDQTATVYMPPKPKPTLPFGMGPAPEPITEDDFTETTIKAHEVGLVKEIAQSMVFPVAIAYFMSLKMNVHVSLVMQSVMLPVNAMDSPIVKKYIFGSTPAYGEFKKKPTAQQIKELNDKAGAGANAEVSDSAAGAIPVDAPRVEELKDETDENEKKKDK